MASTLRQRNTAHRFRLQVLMNAQHKAEIGERIKELRDNSPETNRSIAEFVGVGERSVAAWIAGGGITYDNARKVAELFEVEEDYVWRGPKGPTPDVLGALNGDAESPEQLDQLLRLMHQGMGLVNQGLATQTELLAGLAEVRLAQVEILSRLERIERRSGESADGSPS